MTLSIAMLMDSIATIKPAKDTSLGLLLEAQRRGHRLFYLEPGDLALRNSVPWARLAPLTVREDTSDWFTLGKSTFLELGEMDVIMQRKEPPVDTQFIYDTMVLEAAQRRGVEVINDPRALRDCNEKLFTLQFPQCIAPTLISRDGDELRRFVNRVGEAILKPLDGMGGESIFRVKAGDCNLNVILETLLGRHMHGHNRCFVIAQEFIPQIVAGDKRILLIDGEPVSQGLARIPQGDEFRGNLAAGGLGRALPLSARDRWIVAQVAPGLRRRGLRFVGLDVIGPYLTEINITSPTCMRELDAQCGLNIASLLFDAIEKKA